jgi:hypothetical protein
MGDFEKQYAQISGGTYSVDLPVYDSGVTFTILSNVYTGFTSQTIVSDADATLADYPVTAEGYPKPLPNTENYFFQKGAGWFELVEAHQSPQEVNQTTSVFTGQNFNIQTQFQPFTYGQKYLERFRTFPYMTLGFNLIRTIDNKKSWPITDTGLRIGSESGNYGAYYYVPTEKAVINVKNIDLFLNPAQGLCYDVWYMSNKYDYPIPSTGLTSPYPQPGGIDWTFIDPKPSKKTFFEFAQTFWLNMINTRNRQFSTDGKTSGYPTLQSIYWKYLTSQEAINIPNDNFTYETMINYVTGLGDYWVRLAEQMMPASTLWMGGTKFENSIFHRQKFVYRLQTGCQILPLPCNPCGLLGNIFPYACVEEQLTCNVYPWDNNNTTVTSFNDVLYQTLLSYLNANSISIFNCLMSTLETTWYLDVKLDGSTIMQLPFYTGYGVNDVPSTGFWLYILQNNLPNLLVDYGLGITFNTSENPTFVIYNLGCDPRFYDKTFELNIGLDFNINCN